MKILLTVLGSVMLLYGISLCFLANFTLGTVLSLGVGLILLLWGVFYMKFKKISQNGFWKYVKIIFILCLCLELVLVGFITVYGVWDNTDYTEDAVIVLGAGIRGDKVSYPLMFRLDKAVDYHKRNPQAIIVLSGGQGPQETVTEAYAMEKYLLEKGVEKNKIVREEKSTSTNENMRFSKAILDRKFNKDYKVAIITNNFHIYRSSEIAKIEGFSNVTHLCAKNLWYDIISSYLRESLAVIKMWVLG